MLQRVIQILFHLSPLAAIQWDGRPGIIGASILLVLLPYIKVQKLRQKMGDARQRDTKRSVEDLERAIARWEFLTIRRPKN